MWKASHRANLEIQVCLAQLVSHLPQSDGTCHAEHYRCRMITRKRKCVKKLILPENVEFDVIWIC